MFRLRQRVCRVRWRGGQPFLQFGTVTRVTSRTYYVDGAKKPSQWWRANVDDAIRDEYLTLCTIYGNARRPHNWTLNDIVRCVCRVRRMERRLSRRKAN